MQLHRDIYSQVSFCQSNRLVTPGKRVCLLILWPQLHPTFKLSLKTDSKEAAPGHLGTGFDCGEGEKLANRPPRELRPQRKGGCSFLHATCAMPGPMAWNHWKRQLWIYRCPGQENCQFQTPKASNTVERSMLFQESKECCVSSWISRQIFYESKSTWAKM